MSQSRPGYVEPHGLGAGREQQGIIGVATAIHELYVPALGVETGDWRAQLQVDTVLQVERRRPKRVRLGGRSAREEALRKVGAITRPRRIRAQHSDATGIAIAPERF